MSRSKKQVPKGKKSVASKRTTNRRTKIPTLQPPSGTYFAYINTSGKRVKAGTRGAKRITVKINREALQKQAARAGRIGGKFAPKAKARQHETRRIAALKGAITRKLNRDGIHFNKEYDTAGMGYHYREYIIPDYAPETILEVILIEEELGSVEFYGVIHGEDEDGNVRGGAFHFEATAASSAIKASNHFYRLMKEYGLIPINFYLRFTYPRGSKRWGKNYRKGQRANTSRKKR